MSSGIYMIECNGNKYVGKSKDIEHRWKDHISQLKRGKHKNKYIQGMWDNYSENFVFSVLEYCPTNEIDKREDYWVETLNTMIPNGMNIMPERLTPVNEMNQVIKFAMAFLQKVINSGWASWRRLQLNDGTEVFAVVFPFSKWEVDKNNVMIAKKE
jgi:hypothetical protein